MSSNNSLTSRLEELRSRNPQSPPSERAYSGYSTPVRYSGSFMPSHSQAPSNDIRASLQRRFTADSGKVPTLTPIGQLPTPQGMEPVDPSFTTFHKVQLLEKKRLEMEALREHRKRFDVEMEKLEKLEANKGLELEQISQDLHGFKLSPGHQSEPTTPPEYRDHTFPSIYSRRNRYSASSLISPQVPNRNSRSGSQLISPPGELTQTYHGDASSDKLPSKSVPGSRRGSNDKVSVYIPENGVVGPRATAATNRYSMPVTGSMTRNRVSVPDYSSVMGLGHINTTGFLFGDDDEKAVSKKDSATSPDVKSYLQMNATDDKFPILVRRDDFPGLLSASSAALDLALSQSPGPESQPNGWTPFARHRPSQSSLPQNIFDAQQSNQRIDDSPSSTSQQSFENPGDSPVSVRQLNRRSMEASLAPYAQKGIFSQKTLNGPPLTRPNLANMQSSYSTNDIPTMKSANAINATISPPKTQAQQHFHNHNASLGRIPPHAVNTRHSRELSENDPRGGVSRSNDLRHEEQTNGFKQLHSELHASATPFGPSTSTVSPVDSSAGPMPALNAQQFNSPAYYGGYGMQMMNMGMTPIHMNNPISFHNQMPTYQPQSPFSTYSTYGGPQLRYPDSQARVMQQRRMQNVEDNARFTNIRLEQCQGEIYSLCKDQHGCRFLQKQLEGQNSEHVHLIFLETNQHVVELMTDPFGNYLCQKLLEYSNDDQRTVLINNASPQMVKIALNQHGTRALQKMIEFISTPEQTQTIIYALKDRVVELIQDLNGNHVIQKCLNRLSPEDAQFIFDAVGANCVVVGTHRHGCCVLQRCIDHASGIQKAQLIRQIIANAFSLVQDPFGNYVLQYIVDLNEPIFTEPLCGAFKNSIPTLSKQKFSSNVIEKCLRGAEQKITKLMIEEMLNANELEKMLRDLFANYVVQTALDYADADTKAQLVEAIRPLLPAIRQTPYGRRIQSKIFGVEIPGRLSGGSTPHDVSTPGQIPLANNHAKSSSPHGTYAPQTLNNFNAATGSYADPAQSSYQGTGIMGAASFNTSSVASSTTHSQRFGNGNSNFHQFNPTSTQNSANQPIPLYGRGGPQTNGFNYF